MKNYKKEHLNYISFPLGGIGTGSFSIAGNGMLADSEINNRPNRESDCGYSGFAIRAEKDGKTIDSRLLCGDTTKDLIGTIRGAFGIGDGFNSGFRHFSEATFSCEFPFAKIELSDSKFPADVTIEAFNPFIPSNDFDSSIPAAFFEITVKNTSNDTIAYSVLQTMTNMLEESGLNKYFELAPIKGITLNSSDTDEQSIKYGNITVATDFSQTSHTDYWFRGAWFDTTTKFADELASSGDLKNRVYDKPIEKGRRDSATLAARAVLSAGESQTIRFLISWYVPNANCYWKENNVNYKNYYSTIFKNSEDVALYCFKNWDRLYSRSKRFSERLYSSSLPEEIKDAVCSNLAILKSTTCLRLEDGSFWGWEGVNRTTGSCEGTCQHVYNYTYALSFLFPKLEKGIRTNEINCCLDNNGKMAFRMPITLKKENWWRACVDGQMGFVIKCYREWKLSGDNDWLLKNIDKIKIALAYAWSDENPDKWDPKKSGVLTGRQHHTLDVELFGVYAWLTGMYHAALYAAAEMTEFVGDTKSSEEYRRICEKGRKILDEKTFNGEYFVQLLNVEDREIIEKLTNNSEYTNLASSEGDDDFLWYWDEEVMQSKYQIENGCEIDQVLAEYHTDLVGLPHVFNQEHRKSALESIYKYNFCEMHDLINPCRVFACNDEKGVIICQWPNKFRKPAFPIPYSQECMSGFEYAVAANMLQCGMEDKALEIVREVRRRYDGKRRNPFAELECGASYARATAAYSFLIIYSGFKFDIPNKTLGFKPLKNGKYFWSVDGAWGCVDCSDSKWIFSVDYGNLELKHFITSAKKVKSVSLNNNEIPFTFTDTAINADLNLSENDELSIIF